MPRNLNFNEYDEYFIEAMKISLPGLDWRWLKAQAFQESRFDPDAKSPAGAIGVMQFMPSTWADGKKAGWIMGRPDDPIDSIYAGAKYMEILMNKWKSPRPSTDRLALSFASYNAGFGHLVEAQKLANGSVFYRDIISELHNVTGHHSQETVTYVRRIFGYYADLVLVP